MEKNSAQYTKMFYECVRKTLFACWLAGFLPISGLMGHNQNSCSSWYYTIYYMASLLVMNCGTVIHLYDYLFTGRHFKDLGGLVVQSFATFGSLYLLKFGLNWKNMVKQIEENERRLPQFTKPQRVVKIINQYMMIMCVYFVMNYVFHLTYTIRIMILCDKEYGGYSTKIYYTSYYAWYYDSIPFNFATTALLQWIMIQTAFVYHFIDALVIVVSSYLVCRWRNFNRLMRIKQKKCVRNTHTSWSDIQAHYTRLARIGKILDDCVNPFVFLSFLSSLVFICKMIYDIIQKHVRIANDTRKPDCAVTNSSDWVSVVYMFSSFSHVLFKTVSVSVLTAHLHHLTREPLKALHTLPPAAYNLELQRFMDQVYHSRITLSGLQFFYVTRGTILAMLSTIVTYELVLLQFPIYS